MVLTGRNFNKSHDYRVVMQSIELDRYVWDLEAQFVSEWNLTVDLSQINTTFNQKCRLQLKIVGNSQLTKNYQHFIYFHVDPRIQLVNPLLKLRRNSYANSYIQLKGNNADIFEKTVSCKFTLEGWNTTEA